MACAPSNHMGVPAPVPQPTPTPVPPSYDWQSWVSQTLLRLEQKQDAGFAEQKRDSLLILARIDEPGWFVKIVKHPIFIVTSSALTTWITTKLATK